MKTFNLKYVYVRLLLLSCISMTIYSCDKDGFVISSKDEMIISNVRVDRLGNWLPTTRSNDELSEMPILVFENVEDYNNTISALSQMDEDERLAYFEKIGFEGAYTLLSYADDELDEIFDLEDSLLFENEIYLYK